MLVPAVLHPTSTMAERLRRIIPGLLLALLLLVAPDAVQAISLKDLPATPPASLVLDSADVLSRSTRTDIEKELDSFRADHVDARLITISRLDYGINLQSLGEELLQSWSSPADPDRTSQAGTADALLLVLIDTQNKSVAIAASPSLEGQLPSNLLRSTARTTMAIPLRQGDRYRQASVDGLTRLAIVLRGGDDPGEPAQNEEAVVVSNVPSQEETAESNAFTWIVVLLVVGSVVPMLTWWVFSR
ncbi:MAG: photosystem II repair protein Psb32 [Cyanobium sp.]